MGTEEPFVLFLQLFHKLKYFKISKYIIPATKNTLLWFNNHHGCCCCCHHPFTQKILDHKETYQNINIEKCLWVTVSQNDIPYKQFYKRFSKSKTKTPNILGKKNAISLRILFKFVQSCISQISLTTGTPISITVSAS